MSDWVPKRFWKAATVTKTDDGYSVLLDTRPVKTPAKRLLTVPSARLADRIAAEFDAQDTQIKPQTMPYTRMANSAIDKVRVQHADVADMLAEYGDSDLLCYRADTPQDLVARQSERWDPLLDWADTALGARLAPRIGVIHAPQDPAAMSVLRKKVHALTDFELAAFHDLVAISGSLVIGFAALEDAWPVDQLWTLSRLDEIWQEEQWGVDEEAQIIVGLKKSAFLHAHAFIADLRHTE